MSLIQKPSKFGLGIGSLAFNGHISNAPLAPLILSAEMHQGAMLSEESIDKFAAASSRKLKANHYRMTECRLPAHALSRCARLTGEGRVKSLRR